VALKVWTRASRRCRSCCGVPAEAAIVSRSTIPELHVYDAGEADGEAYIAMRFVDGESSTRGS